MTVNATKKRAAGCSRLGGHRRSRRLRRRRAVGSRRARAARHADRQRPDRGGGRRAHLFQQGSLERRSGIRRRRLRMQLKKRRSASRARDRHAARGGDLRAARATRLPGKVSAQELMPWDIDTSLLIYSESDGRVRDTSLNARARKEMREEKFLEPDARDRLADGRVAERRHAGEHRADVHEPVGQLAVHGSPRASRRSIRRSSTRAPRSARAGKCR